MEVKRLKIPYPLSIQRIDRKFFYLYPKDFAERLNKCKRNIQILKKNPKSNEVQLHGRFSEVIEIDDSSSIYILTEFPLEINQSVDDLYYQIREIFNPLLIILSFLLMNIVFIKRSFIIEKNNSLSQFKRYFQISYENILEQRDTSLIQDFDKELRKLEVYLPLLLFQTFGKIDYLYVIEDYLEAKLRNFSIEVQIIRYWNALEHLSELFWNKRGKNRLLTDTKYKNLSEKINAFSVTIKEEDVVFPNTTLDRAKELLNSKINNYPSIKDEIFEMCKRIRFNLDRYNYEELIRRMYWIRNELFHRGPPLRTLAIEYGNNFHLPNFTLKDLSREILIFGGLIEKIFLTLLGFMPKYLYLEERDELNYKLRWRLLGFSKSYIIPRLERINHLLHLSSRSFSLDADQLKLSLLENEKAYLSYSCKKVTLISFLCLRLFPLIDNDLHNPNLKGKIETSLGALDIQIKFIDAINGILKGNYVAYAKNNNEFRWWMDCKGSFFKSEISSEYHLEFEFIPTTNIFSTTPETKFISKKELIGFFETFIIDINDF